MINIDADAIFSVKSFIIYLIAINIITFLVMGLDKWKAKHGSWRIQEATLFTLVLFGGGIGGILRRRPGNETPVYVHGGNKEAGGRVPTFQKMY